MKIYVFCHIGASRPNGGVKILFEYAQALIDSGYDACILIPGAHLYPYDCPKGYKPSWFETNVPVEDDVRVVTKDDVVVIHEEGIWCYEHLAVNNPRMIMINQGAQSSLTDNVGMHISYEFAHNIYKKCLGVVTISPYISDFVNNVFDIDEDKIHMIENPVDDYFTSTIEDKTNTILIMNKQPGNVVSKMIEKIIHGRYPGWKIKIVHGLSHRELAKEMAKAKIFLFLCTPHGEGSALPPVEAALSGCRVVGYSGLGSRYYWQYPNFKEIEYNDVTAFITHLDCLTPMLGMKEIYATLYNNYLGPDSSDVSMLRQSRSLSKFKREVNRVFKEILQLNTKEI